MRPAAKCLSFSPRFARGLRLLLDQRADEIVDRKGPHVGRHHAGVEL